MFALLRTWGLALLIVAAGLGLAWHFVAPPPPPVLRIAAGPPESFYRTTAEAYAKRLRAEGVQVEVLETPGALENLAMLREGAAEVGLVQGGLVSRGEETGLLSLGGIAAEAAWVFYRRDTGLPGPMRVQGRRVAVGPEGSGTRALALALLAANDMRPEMFTAVPLAGIAAAEALLAGEVDVAIFVSAAPGPAITRLLHAPRDKVALANFATRAEAYALHFPTMRAVSLPRGALSLSEDLPREPATLLAATAFVAARPEIGPALQALLVRVMQEVHRPRQFFAAEGVFPTQVNQELPVPAHARTAHERGPGILYETLPFGVASTVDRLWVLLIPLLTLALPLLRLAPPLYSWQMRMRIWRWYDRLRRIEAEAAGQRSPTLAMRLDELEAQVSRIGVPAGYATYLFALRQDIDYVRARLRGER